MSTIFVSLEETAEYFSVLPPSILRWVSGNEISSDTYIETEGTYRFNIEGVNESMLANNGQGYVPARD
tara:strand:+ start:305 stop:508 length:204 start_codon:yes stop_codon:yes gene_type:complete